MLKSHNLLIREGVGLGNNRDKVDLCMQPLHDLDVQRLQGMTRRLDEEDACMDPIVNNIHAVDLVFGIQVSVETLLDVVDNGSPRLVVVHKVTKAGGINNRQAQTHTSLLNIGANGLDRHRLGDDVKARALALLRWVKGCVEQGVDKGGLSKPGFACKAFALDCTQTFKLGNGTTYQQP